MFYLLHVFSFCLVRSLTSSSISPGDSTLGRNGAGDGDGKTAEKRRSTDQPQDAPSQKKISMSFGPKPNVAASKISFNLGGSKGMSQNKLSGAADKGKVSKPVMPIKMSLGSVQVTIYIILAESLFQEQEF